MEFEEDRDILKDSSDFPQWIIEEVIFEADRQGMTLVKEELEQLSIIGKAIKYH